MNSNRHWTRARSASIILSATVATTLVATAPHASGAARPEAAGSTTHPAGVGRGAVVRGAAAVGRLAPTGCVHDAAAGTDVCDLYAMAGTSQVLGHDIPIWGFSTDGTAGSATAPGPLLVVGKGDTVTVRLHNKLDKAVSLAFPGQPAGAFTAGLGSSTTGAAPDGTQEYSFTAGRAGTFLYEAGHTPDGARQVAMGLAGALVVSDGTGTEAGQSYDDEAVVVLSDLDPRLNAAPGTFDMRDYKARYRLINGRPFPSTSVIATDQGHKVLLRYVNAGAVSHPMATLGATQAQLSDDGHLLGDPEREIVATLNAGTTADTVVTMPTGPETKVTLYEAGNHLNNDGQTELDPGKVAAGGMIAFLDTNAPPPIDDFAGPTSTHVAVSPNPSDGKTDVTVTADVSDAKAGGSKVVAAEYTVDDPDVGVGHGVPLTSPGFDAVTVTGATATIPAAPTAPNTCTEEPLTLSCLSAGKHVVYVRGKDAANNWGAVGSVVLNLPKTGPSTTNGTVDKTVTNGSAPLSVSATGDDSAADGLITKAEVFLDQAGDDGSGLALTLNRSATVVSEDVDIPTTPAGTAACDATVLALSCMTEGTHHLLVHSFDSLGLWGPVLDIPFTVDRTGPSVDAAAVSPNPSNGLVSSPGNTGYLKVSALLTDREPGGAPQSRLTAAEGFFAPSSSTPKAGSGFQLLAVDSKFDAQSEQVYGLIPLSQVKTKPNGSYQVYVRGRDEAGNWGGLFAMPLVVDKTSPVLASVSGSPNPTNGAALLTLTAPVTQDTTFQTAEFWTGTTDPGVGKATRVSVSYVNGSAVASVPTANITPGTVRFNLRVQDMAGNWSNAVSTTVTVTRPNAVFSDTFDSGNLTSWSARTNVGTGSMGVSPTAGIPVVAGNQGLSLTGPGTHFVTDNTPVAETGYHASFGFSAGSFTSGTAAAITLFDARTGNNGGNGAVFSLDHRKNGGVNQVRVVMSRTGAATVTGGWVNLTTGPHTLRLDWVSGPATGAGQGTLKLSVDGTAVSTLTGNTSTLRIESVRLGLVAGTNGSSLGTAAIDSFASTRNTLP
jgi:hypothetical protein